LKAKSEELAKKLGHDNFKATDGWLSRWKVRNNIKFKKAQGKQGSADNESAELWKPTNIPTFLEMMFTMRMNPAFIIVLRQMVLYVISKLHSRGIKKRWTALLY